jgi:3' exoribonuclease, RNase T-like
MKYFIDTEFIEGFHKPWFGKRRHFIDLISIGIVGEDGSQFYAVSSEFNPKDADQWVKDNVISKLPPKKPVPPENQYHRDIVGLQYGRLKNKEIITMASWFMGCRYPVDPLSEVRQKAWYAAQPIEVYGYFSDYDWVLFCSLFGRMMDLPKDFPMYCHDLKQMLDERGLDEAWARTSFVDADKEQHDALQDAIWNHSLYRAIMDFDEYPKVTPAIKRLIEKNFLTPSNE